MNRYSQTFIIRSSEKHANRARKFELFVMMIFVSIGLSETSTVHLCRTDTSKARARPSDQANRPDGRPKFCPLQKFVAASRRSRPRGADGPIHTHCLDATVRPIWNGTSRTNWGFLAFLFFIMPDDQIRAGVEFFFHNRGVPSTAFTALEGDRGSYDRSSSELAHCEQHNCFQ
jgi:hypothetical protein